jgi:hypothetical protein
MSTIEIKSEVIRLVNEMDGDLMEDLLSSIKIFMRQQEQIETDTNSEQILGMLNKSLGEVEKDSLLSNDEILNETKKWLTK